MDQEVAVNLQALAQFLGNGHWIALSDEKLFMALLLRAAEKGDLVELNYVDDGDECWSAEVCGTFAQGPTPLAALAAAVERYMEGK